jgi:uncharacterized membrane protein YdbT with pleckstrin-like domain
MSALVLRPSIKGVLVWYIVSALLLAGIVMFIVWREFEPVWLWGLLVIPIGIDVAVSVRYLLTNSRRLILETDVLRLEEGLVSKAQRSVILDKIRDVRVEQSAGQRLAGVGNLRVEAVGEAGSITLDNVDRPRQAADAILNAVRQSRRTPKNYE